MSTIKLLISVFILIITLTLAACGSEESQAILEEQGFNEADSKVTVVTAGQGGTWYGMMGAYADLVNKGIKGTTMNVTPSGGAAENVNLMKNESSEIGFLTSYHAYDALNGKGIYDGEKPIEHLRAMAMTDPLYISFVVKADSDIKSFEDFKGKRIGRGEAGSVSHTILGQIFKEYGLNEDDLKGQNIGSSDQAEALKDGNLDIFAYVAGGPSGASAALLELGSTLDIRYIEIDGEFRDKIASKYPYVPTIIPAGHMGNKEDVETMQIGITLAVSDKLSENYVYELTKTLFENHDQLIAAHKSWAGLSANDIPIPLHPGAEKYYKEKGIETTFLELK
ncbi:TAXI family TRAP transporter solute-binding subunit [Bacillus sp. JJ1532]|uniref:TAXI family TRAP transporter solute-binding subunit n=1 Tax=Bacillus sp. JJ1532 TaxID=3122958 RepID=UPI003000EB7A